MKRTEDTIGPNPSGLCMCGCGQPTALARLSDSRRGNVIGQPVRFIHGHRNRLSDAQYIVNPETGCWEWQMSRNAAGYGTTSRNSKFMFAHRFMYEKHRGPATGSPLPQHILRESRSPRTGHPR